MSDLFTPAPEKSSAENPRIELIQISNIGPIEDAKIDYAGGMLVAAVGANGTGKSTASLVYEALQGKFDAKTLKAGADKGSFEIEFTYQGAAMRCVCTLTKFTSGTESRVEQVLQFFGPDSRQIGVGKAQDLVKFLVGTKPEFDPNEFISTTAPAQRKTMLQKLSGVDLTPFILAEKEAEKARTDANRDVKAQEARALPYDAELAEKSPVDAATLAAEKQALLDHNAKVSQAIERRETHVLASDQKTEWEYIETAKTDLKTKFDAEIKRLTEQYNGNVATLELRAKETKARENEAKEKVKVADTWLALPENAPKTEDEILSATRKLASLNEDNEKITKAKELKKEADTLAKLKTVAATCEQSVLDAREAKLTAIKTAQLPAGLAFDPDSEVGLLLNGQPIERASSAELTIAALQCATRGTGALHWIHVDCKALDYVNFTKVCEWLKAQGWQGLLEKPAQNESELPLQFHVV